MLTPKIVLILNILGSVLSFNSLSLSEYLLKELAIKEEVMKYDYICGETRSLFLDYVVKCDRALQLQE